MEDVKSNIAKNITELRKSKKWTQVELAEKLNYTDKAISKWERGESTPDVEVLYMMSQLFGVTIDYFFHSDSSENLKKYLLPKSIMQKRIAQICLIITAVIFVSVAIFVYQTIKDVANARKYWVAFIVAVPISCIVLFIAMKKEKNYRFLPLVGSVFVWSSLASIYLYFLVNNENVWIIFLIGLPLQVALLIGGFLRK
ncbi:MAG: helix-turn-helix domain-containing protein [Erysipelotrichaceae bacterium]|nr:helix-turn-helix domain-containing protein [Erysipelotrichaceae bacterium]